MKDPGVPPKPKVRHFKFTDRSDKTSARQWDFLYKKYLAKFQK